VNHDAFRRRCLRCVVDGGLTCRADSRSSGLYLSSRLMRSVHSGATCAMSFSMPLPSFGGKLKSCVG
jgi:hypothetical protein